MARAALFALLVAAVSFGEVPFRWEWKASANSRWITWAELPGSPVQRADIRTALSVGLIAQKYRLAEEELRQLLENLVFSVVDLNGDGVPEFIARASDHNSCSPTGNCPTWVVSRVGGKFRVILQEDIAQTVTVQSHRTNGFREIVLAMHGDAVTQRLHVYRYAKGTYSRAACYEAVWGNLADGTTFEEPKLTKCR